MRLDAGKVINNLIQADLADCGIHPHFVKVIGSSHIDRLEFFNASADPFLIRQSFQNGGQRLAAPGGQLFLNFFEPLPGGLIVVNFGHEGGHAFPTFFIVLLKFSQFGGRT